MELKESDGELLFWEGRYHFPIAALEYLKPDGILLGAFQEKDLPITIRSLPRLGFSNRFKYGIIPSVRTDDEAAGNIAVQQASQAGYERVAILCQSELWHAHQRAEGARSAADTCGLEVRNLEMSYRKPEASETFQDVWREKQEEFHSFLEALPANTVVITTAHGHAHQALSVLQETLGRNIPEDVGVIVIDLIDPTSDLLASVLLDGEQAGRRLAQRLLLQLNGKKDPAPAHERISPQGFLAGQSVRGGEIISIYNRIQEWCDGHISEDVSVDDLCHAIGISRRSLELKLQAAGLTPPYELLTRLRLQEAKSLLQNSTLRIEEVAERCGFHDGRALRKRFQAYTGITPIQWRKDRNGDSGVAIQNEP